jgi:hypothetical protein
MKLFELRNEKGYFTELIKIENFTTIKEALERINKWIEGVDDLSDYDEDDLCNTKDKDGKDYKYVQISGDGICYFVESLNEFDGKYKTEDGWGVEYSFEIQD